MAGVEAAFPTAMRETASAAGRLMPAAPLDAQGSFVAFVDGEAVEIPVRIYNPEPGWRLSRWRITVDQTTRDVLACLYTRHHDGRVRQRNLGRVLEISDSWVAPYVVQLIGEYVVEILFDIRHGLKDLDVEGSRQRLLYGAFIAANPQFLELTAQRVESYWNCYYRHSFRRDEYPGFALIASLRCAAAAVAAMR